MDDGSKQPHTFGSGQQRTHHPRPFFYVQPPSQPYYLYQHWQLNNPYSHYGLPGGFNFGRPCIHPFQYMQYPGFVFPHAPVYPTDYRRMFEPRFHAPTWSDMPRQQHHPQPHGRREMACSEAQTDPSDAITKLIECLDKIRANEMQGAERELDSGVASQSSGMFSPGEEKKSEEQGHALPSVPDDSHLECPAVTFCDSTTAVYDGESSQRSLDALSPQGCWSGGLEEELPIDSSSVHEDCPELEQPAGDEHFLPLRKEEVTDFQSDILVTDPSVPRCDAEELQKSTSSLTPSSSQPVLKEARSSDKVLQAEHQTGSFDEAKSDPSYQILKLPFESALTPGAAGACHLSSPAAPYYYNYLSMQTTHERMSVLSPSLDELSSRDEMFSTDLDEVDLFPKHVYTGRRLAEVIGASPQAAEEVEEVWLPGSKRFVCACCGKSLAKGAGRSKVTSSKIYRDEAGDSEEESRYGRGCEQPVRVVVRKHSAPRKPHSVPLRHATKSWYKRGQYKDPSGPFDQEEGHNLFKQEPADGEIGKMTGSELQCRTCQDRLCREDLTTSEQGRWGDGDVIPRRRQATPLQRPEMGTQRKMMHHRPRDEDNDDDEPPSLHWERGSTMRGEPRC
ncbi:bucky ball-like [Toxotes jaculatrix]|uniref:bucky ball-like n=1 Tax=Toxotes jaculatrix TaxID=941984 RepID=UPI001B3B1A25|nr:bucky ball-like [Toxotes jaculatrix]